MGSMRGAGGRRSLVRGGLLHALAVGTVCATVLAGCAVKPSPLTLEETAQRIAADRARLEANRPALDGPLALHRAMAHALLRNLDARVRAMEHDLALGQAEVARLGLLAPVTARYGVTSRSNAQASSSRSVRPGRESLSASTSSDDTRRSGDLRVAWHVLRFRGVVLRREAAGGPRADRP